MSELDVDDPSLDTDHAGGLKPFIHHRSHLLFVAAAKRSSQHHRALQGWEARSKDTMTNSALSPCRFFVIECHSDKLFSRGTGGLNPRSRWQFPGNTEASLDRDVSQVSCCSSKNPHASTASHVRVPQIDAKYSARKNELRSVWRETRQVPYCSARPEPLQGNPPSGAFRLACASPQHCRASA